MIVDSIHCKSACTLVSRYTSGKWGANFLSRELKNLEKQLFLESSTQSLIFSGVHEEIRHRVHADLITLNIIVTGSSGCGMLTQSDGAQIGDFWLSGDLKSDPGRNPPPVQSPKS